MQDDWNEVEQPDSSFPLGASTPSRHSEEGRKARREDLRAHRMRLPRLLRSLAMTQRGRETAGCRTIGMRWSNRILPFLSEPRHLRVIPNRAGASLRASPTAARGRPVRDGTDTAQGGSMGRRARRGNLPARRIGLTCFTEKTQGGSMGRRARRGNRRTQREQRPLADFAGQEGG